MMVFGVMAANVASRTHFGILMFAESHQDALSAGVDAMLAAGHDAGEIGLKSLRFLGKTTTPSIQKRIDSWRRSCEKRGVVVIDCRMEDAA